MPSITDKLEEAKREIERLEARNGQLGDALDLLILASNPGPLPDWDRTDPRWRIAPYRLRGDYQRAWNIARSHLLSVKLGMGG